MLSLFPPPGPSLPSFSTLLVTGSYHLSAPLHLAISHVLDSPQHEVLILSSSRTMLRKKLVSGSDEWLSHSGSTSKLKVAMSRILILYPPTPAHFSLLAATLDGTQSVSEVTYLLGDLPVLPTENLSLIILDGLSLYFTSTDVAPFQISSFMSLVQCLIQSINRISAIRNGPSRISIACFEASLFEPQRPHNHLRAVIPYLFQKVAHFGEIEGVPSSQTEEMAEPVARENQTRKCLQILSSGDSKDEETYIEYMEVVTTCADNSVFRFLWQ